MPIVGVIKIFPSHTFLDIKTPPKRETFWRCFKFEQPDFTFRISKSFLLKSFLLLVGNIPHNHMLFLPVVLSNHPPKYRNNH